MLSIQHKVNMCLHRTPRIPLSAEVHRAAPLRVSKRTKQLPSLANRKAAKPQGRKEGKTAPKSRPLQGMETSSTRYAASGGGVWHLPIGHRALTTHPVSAHSTVLLACCSPGIQGPPRAAIRGQPSHRAPEGTIRTQTSYLLYTINARLSTPILKFRQNSRQSRPFDGSRTTESTTKARQAPRR